MLKKTKIASVVAMAALVAACGGGGGDDEPSALPNTGATPTAPVNGDSGSVPDDNGPATPPDVSNPTNPGDPDPGTEQPDDGGGEQATDTQLNGRLSIVANQLVYLRTSRLASVESAPYNAFTIDQFQGLQGGKGLYDAATGSETAAPGSVTDNNPYDGRIDPPAAAPAAPVASFGFRINRFVQTAAGEALPGAQAATGRVAFNFVERAGTAGIGTNEVAEQMTFVIDGVELSTNAAGELTGVRVKAGAQVHVYGRSSTNGVVNASFPASPESVRLLPLFVQHSNQEPRDLVLDAYGDTSSAVLLFDLEHAFSQAGTSLQALQYLEGEFDMDVTLSAALIDWPQDDGSERRALTGKPITVAGQPTVTGAGISGTAWIRTYPPEGAN